ncbi:hypothetical protein NCS57_00125500 [Fusarium keratoplasticum]|uniref:Uncharacterized protein n=1 Tax=Fusarium keratoplasticum TaxID=1328300 RepID=A0ACC0REQ4_9HYPO|nr:hypothetical protein NCS57_00125500 [Fusarium keratoplasticum]KAI8684591.1 hypothetical protein NCS57_00125500 [Fusarium keratoplasticum]
MPSSERDSSREGDLQLRHQHSASSDHFRALVPMWDSSDPERCPPPLPLNPGSPLSSRAGTSSAIQSAHAALSERARESAMPHLNRRLNDASPTKSNSHRRLQSSSVRDISLMIEGNSANNSPARSPERPSRPETPSRSREPPVDNRPIEKEPAPSNPGPGPSLTPILRPAVRRPPPQSILGENTPPQSSTMLALQNMSSLSPTKEPENPLSNITNGSSALVKHPQNLEQLSNQILSLTSIATNLQKEMSQLSRRSRDNATDLLSLKEATNTRDEDIRRSLRELLGSSQGGGNGDGSHRLSSRDPFGGYYLDNKPHNLSPPGSKPFQLPRIPSPKSFSDSIERGSISTPSLAGSEAPASIALLEKIIRDMPTKEGQDSLLTRLLEVSNKLSGMATSQKLDEVIEQVRAQSEQAIVLGNPLGSPDASRSRNLSFGDELSHMDLIPGQARSAVSQRVEHIMKNEARRNSEPASQRANIVNDDLMAIIRSVKDSVAQGGGLTAEVKALVRELRGEVLGMGREIGRRLEQQASRRNVDDHDSPSKDEVARVIDEGLEQMKDQLNHVLREHRRQSAASVNTQKSAVDYQEIYNAMRAAIQDNEATRNNMPDLSREDVIEAVRDAWENYKPEIEVQQLGLERDEVLACLKEGLREFAPAPAATRDEVFTAVVEGLKHFVPPQVEQPETASREEIIDAVRDCLEEFEFPVAPGNNELTREDMVIDATKDGFENLRKAMESYVDRAAGVASQEDFLDDLLKSLDDFKDEVAGLVANANMQSREQLQTELEGLRDVVNSSMVPALPPQLNNTEVLEALNTGFNNLRQEILRPRAETSEILDALNDGLNDLRAGMDRVTNKPADLTANDEILDALKTGLDSVRSDIDTLRENNNERAVATLDAPPQANDELLDALKAGLGAVRSDIEALRDGHAEKALTPAEHKENDEVLEALKTGLESIRADIETIRETTKEPAAAAPVDNTTNDEVIEALKNGLDSLRVDIEALHSSHEKALAPVDNTTNDEVIEALKNGLDSLRVDIEAVRDSSDKAVAQVDNHTSDEFIEALKNGLESLRVDIEAIRDSNERAVAPVAPVDNTSNDEVIEALKNGLDSLRVDIEALHSSHEKAVAPVDNTTNDEVIEALKNGLDAIRTDIETLQENHDKALAPVADTKPNDEVLDALKTGLESLRSEIESLRDSNDRAVAPVDAGSDDKILDALKSGLESVRSDIEALRDNNTERALGPVLNDREPQDIPLPPDTVRHDDIRNLEVLITELRVKVEALEPQKEGVQKDDLTRMEEMIRNVQDTVDDIGSREMMSTRAIPTEKKERSEAAILGDPEDAATKEDVQAIETILRNTKGKLDDLIDGDQAVRKDHIDNVETLLLETRETMGSITTQMETVSRKEEITGLETLISQITTGLDELKGRLDKESENPDKVVKADVETVEALALEIKTALDGYINTDLALLARKEDVSGLEALVARKEDVTSLETVVKEFQEKLDTTVEAQTKAIAVRDEETTNVAERVNEVKNFLEELQGAINTKLEEGASGVEGVSKLLETMGEKIDKNENVHQDLKDMLDTIKSEFEDSKAVVAGVKIESNEKLQETTESLGNKIDEKIGELIAKYESLSTQLDERSKVSEARDEAVEAAVVGSKAVTDELKLLIDTLGSTVTDSLEKMEEASKTVFTKVEELVTRNEETHTEDKAEHQQTRDQISLALSVVEGLKGEVTEGQPKIMEAVKDLLLLVSEHFEHSKTSVTDIQEKLVENKPPEILSTLLPPEKYDNTEVHEKLNNLVEHIYNDSEVRERLDKIIEEKYDDTEVRGKLDKIIEDKYDDAQVHEKLTTIIGHKYDDSEVKEKLEKIIADKYDDAEVRTKLDKIIEDKYNDAEVREMLNVIIDQKYDDAEVREKLGFILDQVIESKYDDTAVREKIDCVMDQVIQQKYDDKAVQDKLDQIIEDKYDDSDVKEKLGLLIDLKYDDTVVHEKLDKLVDHSSTTDQALTRLETLDKVHASVVQTAADISEFLSAQKQRIEQAHEDHEKTLRETMASVERKLAEKDHVEASVSSLREEEERLRQSVMSLRTEQESLIRQKTRLTGDVSSLETALRVRKEELYDMESRAENLERRILEGVMDHSRVLLMSKANKNSGDAMSRKRVKKPATETDSSQPARKSMVSMALNAKRNLAAPAQTGSARRIVSLSQINNNVVSGGVKRSQSVRTPMGGGKAYRKRSLGGHLDKGPGDNDKENVVGLGEAVEELDEADARGAAPEAEEPGAGDTTVLHNDEAGDSDNETLRRSSRGTVVTNSTDMYTEGDDYSEYSDDTGSEWTESAVGTDAGSIQDQGNEVVVYGS